MTMLDEATRAEAVGPLLEAPVRRHRAESRACTITLQVVAAADQLPDADIDVLIWHGGNPQSDLGAWIGYHDDGTVHWVNAQGRDVLDVTHWAEMPCIPTR